MVSISAREIESADRKRGASGQGSTSGVSISAREIESADVLVDESGVVQTGPGVSISAREIESADTRWTRIAWSAVEFPSPLGRLSLDFAGVPSDCEKQVCNEPAATSRRMREEWRRVGPDNKTGTMKHVCALVTLSRTLRRDFGRYVERCTAAARANGGALRPEGREVRAHPDEVGLPGRVNSRLICATFSLRECATCWGTVSARVNSHRGGKEGALSHGTQHDQVPEAAGTVQHQYRFARRV